MIPNHKNNVGCNWTKGIGLFVLLSFSQGRYFGLGFDVIITEPQYRVAKFGHQSSNVIAGNSMFITFIGQVVGICELLMCLHLKNNNYSCVKSKLLRLDVSILAFSKCPPLAITIL